MSEPKIQRGVVVADRGAPQSPMFQDIYASRDGAAAQARFVFLEGNGLPRRWQGKDQFVILENGFGLGTNFLATLKAWREDPCRSRTLDFVSIEQFPVRGGDLLKFCDPELKEEAMELAAQWPPMTPGVHRVTFDEGRVVLTLCFADVRGAASKIVCGFDAFYPDGFSPDKNPQMWEPAVLKQLCAHARPEATLATWCVAGRIREVFTQAGFEVRKKAGFGHKSEMTVGVFAPKFRHRRLCPPEVPAKAAQSAIVVGAGLAGAAVAETLTSAGIRVEVLDAAPVAGAGASAIRCGIAHAQPSGDDNPLFRFSRAGLFALQKALRKYPEFHEMRGLFQMARNEEELERWKNWVNRRSPFAFEESFLRLMEPDEALIHLGVRPLRGGLWHAGAGVVYVAEWVRSRLEKAGAKVRTGIRVDEIRKAQDSWEVRSSGLTAARADLLILCSAYGVSDLLGERLPLTQWKGRLSLLCEGSLPEFKGALTGPGYLIKAPDGWMGVGATYESAEASLSIPEAHEKNLGHIASFFGDGKKALAAGFYEGFRCVAKDRMPVIGNIEPCAAFPDTDGLYVSAAMGSRGTVFSDLAAQMILAEIEGRPAPVEADLLRMVSPARLMKSS